VRDAVLGRIERDPAWRAVLGRRWGEVTTRMLRSSVFEAWRRLDWGRGYAELDDEQAENQLSAIGLSLKKPMTVFGLWDSYRALPTEKRNDYWAQRLCVRIPMGSFHAALLSGQRALAAEVAPRIREIPEMLDFKRVDSGETHYLAVVLSLHLVALQ